MPLTSLQIYLRAFLLLAVCIPALSNAATAEDFAGGDGSLDNPYLIETPAQLNLIREDLRVHYRLTADIDLGGDDPAGPFYNEGLGWSPIGFQFLGTLDGNHHAIDGLFINRPGQANVGLFSFLLNAGVSVKNLLLLNAQVTGGDNTGSLSGRFTGVIDSVRVLNSTVNGSEGAYGTDATGGLVGDTPSGTLIKVAVGSAESCLSGKATPSNLCGAVTVSGEYAVGGLIGNLGGTVTQSYAVATVQGTYQIGGLVGHSTGHVNTSYALLTGSLGAQYNYVGGLVGHNDSSTSTVSDSYVGTLNESFTLAVSTQNGSLVGVNAGTVSASTSFFTALQSNSASLTGSSSSGTVVPIVLEPETLWHYSDNWRTYSLVNSGMPYLAWQSFPFLPSINEFSGPVTAVESTIQASITFEDLLALGDQADNGSIVAFRVRTLSSGSLVIDGQPYDYANGVRDITASQSAQWTTTDENYGEITAFLVSVVDDDGLESSTAQAFVPVKLTLQPLSFSPLYANPISGIAATKEQTISIDVGSHFTAKHGTTLIYSAQWLPDGFTISEDEGIIIGQYATSNDEDVWVYNIQVTAEAVGKNVSTTTGFPLAYFSGGDLSQGEPLLIEHPEQLDALRNLLEPEYKFKLMRHLNMSDKSYQWTSGSGWSGIGKLEAPFQGQFDGNHYTISNFYTNYSDGDHLGLFGVLGSSGRISNLNLRYVGINGQDHVGALVGLNNGTIESSTAIDVEIQGRDSVGGLVGSNGGTLDKIGLIIGAIEGRNYVGGLVGENTSGQIDSSLTLGFGFDSNSNVGGESAVGGLVGKNSGMINDSGALMIIGGDSDLGTLVGVNTASGVINRALSAGVIVDSNLDTEKGELLGSNAGTINNSFRFAFADDAPESLGTVLTEEEFANSETFTNAGWDLDVKWEMTSPQNFPFIAPVPRWILNPNPPRMTQIESPLTTVQPNSIMDTAITAEAIASVSDADYFNPADALFRVVALKSGQLIINDEPFEAGSNEYIGYYQGELNTFRWLSDDEAAGIVPAFTVVAASNVNLQESSTPVAVEFFVNSAPQGSVPLNYSAIVLFPFSLDLNNIFNDPQGDRFILTVLGSAPGLSVDDGVISGTPDEIGSYLFTVRATDANNATSSDYDFTLNVIIPPVPEDTTPPPPPIPNVGDNSNSLNNDLDEIVLPLPGEPLSPEVAAKLAEALNKANENIENTAQQIRNGNLSNGDALLSLLSTNKAVGKVGDAAPSSTGNSDAVRSLQGVSGVLNELAGRGNLSQQEKQQVNDIAKSSLSNGGKLIRDDSTAAEVESILNATTDVLNNALKTGAPLDEELATTAIQLSLKALNQVLPGFAAALGKNVDLNDPAQVRNLMAEPVVLESALKNSIALRSTETLDDSQVEQNLAGQGVNAQAAKRILESLRGAIANPNGISIAGDVTRSATQSLLDALLGAFANVAAEGLSGTGLHLMAATQGLSVKVDPLTGAITVANDTQRYAATSTSVRLVSSSVPEGVSYLPDGRAVAIANGMAIELAPAAVDLLGFAAAIERNGFAVNFRSNGSFAFSLADGEQFSGSFAFDDVGNNAQACGDISFTAPQTAMNAAEYVFVMECANGIRQHITPFVHDAGFYTAISQSGLTVRTDRNTGIITIPSVGRLKPSFFVTPLTDIDIALRTEKGNPAIAFRAVPNDNGSVDFELITASGVQRLYAVP